MASEICSTTPVSTTSVLNRLSKSWYFLKKKKTCWAQASHFLSCGYFQHYTFCPPVKDYCSNFKSVLSTFNFPHTFADCLDGMAYWSKFLHTFTPVVFSSSHLSSLPHSFSVSAVPWEHIRPGEPASGDVCSAGSCCGCWRRLQWQGHIWLHAQRLYCACI